MNFMKFERPYNIDHELKWFPALAMFSKCSRNDSRIVKYDNRNGKRRKFDKRSLCRVWLRNKSAYSKSVQYSLFESEWLPHSNNIILDRTRSTISLLWGVLLCSYIPQEKSGKMTNITSLWRHSTIEIQGFLYLWIGWIPWNFKTFIFKPKLPFWGKTKKNDY